MFQQTYSLFAIRSYHTYCTHMDQINVPLSISEFLSHGVPAGTMGLPWERPESQQPKQGSNTLML